MEFIDKDINYLLSDKRFNLSRTEVKNSLNHLLNQNLIKKEDYDKINEEDTLIKIKYKSLKKCKNKAALSVLFLIIGFLLKIVIPIFSILIIFGFILLISSAFGLQSNKLTKKQINYIKTTNS